MFNFYYLPQCRRPGTGDIATPPVRPSVCPVCLSVTFSFRTNSKTHWCIFSKLCRYVHNVMGVCCIVFDIDGILFEFFMNFLNIEKNTIKFFFFQYFQFSSRFMLFPTLKKKLCKKKNPGGGGVDFLFFFRKTIPSHFTLYAIFNIKKNILKSAPSLTG